MEYQGQTIFLAKYDIIFKAVFLGDGDYSLLASLLSSILNVEIEADDVTILNVELPPEYESGKLSRLDIRIKTPDGKQVNVEIQLTDEKNMDKRSIFHLSKLYTGQMTARMKFKDLGPAIAINILDFKYLPYKEYHNVYRLKNIRNNDELTNVFEINFIELPKVAPETGDALKDLWMRFISAENEEVLEMLAKENPVIDEAVKKLVYVSADELVRYEMEMREKAELDYRSAMMGQYEEGRQEGERIGEARGERIGEDKKSIEVAKELLKMDMNIDQISKITKLSVCEINKLKE